MVLCRISSVSDSSSWLVSPGLLGPIPSKFLIALLSRWSLGLNGSIHDMSSVEIGVRVILSISSTIISCSGWERD